MKYLVAALLVTVTSAFAQVSERNYLPLTVGNVWEYKNSQLRETQTVVEDSLLPSGSRIVWLRSVIQLTDQPPGDAFFWAYEIDSAGGVWTNRGTYPDREPDERRFDLRAGVGDRWRVNEYDTYAGVTLEMENHSCGEMRIARRIDEQTGEDSLWMGSRVLVDGIGLYQSFFDLGVLTTLVGARINGRIYGRLTSTAEPQAPGRRSTVHLELHGRSSRSMTSFDVETSASETLAMALVDMRGGVHASVPGIEVAHGVNTTVIDVSELQSSPYLLVLTGKAFSAHQLVVVSPWHRDPPASAET